MTTYSFRLYVAGDTQQSQAALRTLRFLCESRLAGQYELEVIDAIERPDLAAEERILAAPTVVRLAPGPQRRVIGDLSDRVRTAAALGIPEPDELPAERR